MLTITNSLNGKKYKILRFDVIKKGDNYLQLDADNKGEWTKIAIKKAKEDYPEECGIGSFILEEIN